MNFDLDPADAAFQAEMRAFIRQALPADIARRGRQGFHATHDDVQAWMRILNARGLAAVHWPRQHGGTDWSPLRRHLFQVELRAAGAPVPDQAALELVGPVIYTFGDEVQKARYLPAILNADTFWCQGFSEPNSGSDLASLKTSAVRDGDHYVVNGQKTWTSEAHKADMMFALVRTDGEARPQAGISFLLIDMKSPGVSVRPIYTINEGLSVNEVFLDNVRVPVENLVGDENRGWGYAKFLLTNERTMSAETPHTAFDLDQVKQIAAVERRGGRPLIEDPLFAARLARFEIELRALETAVLRVLHMDEGDPALNATASVLKLRGSELRQRIADLAVEALGDHGLAVFPDVEGQDNMDVLAPVPPAPDYAAGWLSRAMFRRATTIYGGANEIQRTIIAKSVLGL
ncbi:alkylation response protein AidB-like acyl-CoA dehydrogenase [Caulobacter rhizosphaerae]|uniref:Alkylation response protein AidB-like acyl-CoA dehydrogenase n=1 Tax=Caulobacter rhizosphaerae TaxID=2010972 RepID=A0ABU1N6P3_9CAUL|nr:acyl-CoA dehydrogenase family protein [Caulobacter rhizosphaerae]MDR6534094.1 alkylation response protein AidB-like acyl-CoA dehydrogenase [Caulobacter rhizosphaerae]